LIGIVSIQGFLDERDERVLPEDEKSDAERLRIRQQTFARMSSIDARWKGSLGVPPATATKVATISFENIPNRIARGTILLYGQLRFQRYKFIGYKADEFRAK